jgi:hypothetical protein
MPGSGGHYLFSRVLCAHSNWPLAFAEINQCECESRGKPTYPRLLLILAMTIRDIDATMFVVSRCTLRWLLGMHRRYIARATGDNDYNSPGDGPIA